MTRFFTGAAVLSCVLMGSMAVAQPRTFAGGPEGTSVTSPDAADLRGTDGETWLREAGRHLSRVAAAVNPAVVHIECSHTARGEVIEETGSGVIMRSPKWSGLFVVTNRHVVQGAPLKEVNIHIADGRILHPIRVLDDMATDLAVLQLREADLAAAAWGDSDNLDIGHVVLAVGSPFGLSQSVTMGIISAKGRRSLSLGGPREVINQDFLQTDAAINPGNSGGPLIDLHGRVVGINTAIASQGGGNEGIGFSIPSNLVRFVVDELLEKGRVQRGYLGVKLDSKFDFATAQRLKLDRLRGARVVQVYKDTPAYLAGLQVDDVILNFDGIDVEDESHLIHRVSLTPINKTVRIVVYRNGRPVTLQVTLTERPADTRAEQPPVRSRDGVFPSRYRQTTTGLEVIRLDQSISRQLGYDGDARGVLVTAVPPTSVLHGADEDSLALYDVIVEVARTPVPSVSEFLAAVHAQPAGAPLVLKVRRLVDGRPTERLVIWRPTSGAE
jgi:serine protease Do